MTLTLAGDASRLPAIYEERHSMEVESSDQERLSYESDSGHDPAGVHGGGDGRRGNLEHQ